MQQTGFRLGCLVLAIWAWSWPLSSAPEAPISLPVYTLQGTSHLSPYAGREVQTQGVVTALSQSGFYLQDPQGDGDDRTSDAIFVSQAPIGGRGEVRVGMRLRVQGTLLEEPVADPSVGLTRTSLQLDTFQILATDQPLPAAVQLGGPQGRSLPKRVISSHQGHVHEKTSLDLSEGLDFYESLEGMRVSITQPRLIAPGSTYGELYLVADQGREALPPLNARHSLLLDLENQDYNPEILILKNPQHPDVQLQSPAFDAMTYRKGDLFTQDIQGVLDFNPSARPGFFVGGYFIYPTHTLPATEAAGLQPQRTQLASGPRQLTIANYNVENLSPQNPPEQPHKLRELGRHIAYHLRAPDILMLQEVADNDGALKSDVVAADQTLQALVDAIQQVGGPRYAFLDVPPLAGQDGGLPGANIRVAYLYQPERVSLLQRPAGDAQTSVGLDAAGHLTLNPGRLAVTDPAFRGTRKSLAAEFVFQGHPILCINNHLSSKRGDGSPWSAEQPPKQVSMHNRLAQTQILHDFAQSVLSRNPQAKLVLAGDFNEFYAAEPLQQLKGQILSNLIESLPFAERYTYIFKGSSQTLDHFFISQALHKWQPEVEVVHLNAEFNPQDGAVSDHDPVVVRFTLP